MGRSHPGNISKGSDRKVGGGGGHKEPLSKRFLTREWQDVVHVDPEQVRGGRVGWHLWTHDAQLWFARTHCNACIRATSLPPCLFA